MSVPGKREVARERPQDRHEGYERRGLVEEPDRQRIRLVDIVAQIVRDALVRVVRFPPDELHPVMRAVVEPLADIETVEKRTPADAQNVLRHDLDQRHRHIDRRQRNEDPEQLIPESGAVLDLQRVEHVAAEKVQTNAERDLEEVDADKPREQHRADPALRGPHDDRTTECRFRSSAVDSK